MVHVFNAAPVTYATGWVYAKLYFMKKHKIYSIATISGETEIPVLTHVLLYDHNKEAPVGPGMKLVSGYSYGEHTLNWTGQMMVEDVTIFGRCFNITSKPVYLRVLAEEMP